MSNERGRIPRDFDLTGFKIELRNSWSSSEPVYVDHSSGRYINRTFAVMWITNCRLFTDSVHEPALLEFCADYIPEVIQDVSTTLGRASYVYFSQSVSVLDKVVEGLDEFVGRIKIKNPSDAKMKHMVEYLAMLNEVAVEATGYFRDFAIFFILSLVEGRCRVEALHDAVKMAKSNIAANRTIKKAWVYHEYCLAHSIYIFEILKSFHAAGLLERPDGGCFYKLIGRMSKSIGMNLFSQIAELTGE